MVRYETLLLTIPHITSDEMKAFEIDMLGMTKQSRGAIISFERWGKFKLAYPVQNNDYGIYFLIRFEVDDERKRELLDALRTNFSVKHGNVIMRFMTTSLPDLGQLDYQRPDSLEDIPTRDVDTFLRENKMEGLLSKPEASKDTAAETEVGKSDDNSDESSLQKSE